MTERSSKEALGLLYGTPRRLRHPSKTAAKRVRWVLHVEIEKDDDPDKPYVVWGKACRADETVEPFKARYEEVSKAVQTAQRHVREAMKQLRGDGL